MAKTENAPFFYGWFVLVGAFGIQMVAWGTNITFGIFFTPLVAEFGWTRAVTSGAYSFHTLLRGVLAIVVGKLSDKYGPRLLVAVCGCFLGFGYILMSQVCTAWQLYVFFGIMVGIGMSGSFVPGATAVAARFAEKKGVATGVFLSGASLGCMLMAPVSAWLIAIYGWRDSYIVIGIVAMALITGASQLLKRSPSQVSQTLNGADDLKDDRVISEAAGLTFNQAIHTRQFWILCAIILCYSFFHATVLVHLVPHAIDLGMAASTAASLLAVLTGVGIVGRIIIGIAADAIGNKPVLTVGFVALVIDFLWLAVGKEYWMLCAFAVVFGLAGSVCIVLSSPIVADLFGMKSHGAILGTVMFGYTIGGASGPLLAGHIFDVTGSYQFDIMICILLSVTGIILTLPLRPAVARCGHTPG